MYTVHCPWIEVRNKNVRYYWSTHPPYPTFIILIQCLALCKVERRSGLDSGLALGIELCRPRSCIESNFFLSNRLVNNSLSGLIFLNLSIYLYVANSWLFLNGWLASCGALMNQLLMKKITFFNEKGGLLFMEVPYRLAESRSEHLEIWRRLNAIWASWILTRLNAIKSGPNKKQPEQIPQGGRLALWIALITSLFNSLSVSLSISVSNNTNLEALQTSNYNFPLIFPIKRKILLCAP